MSIASRQGLDHPESAWRRIASFVVILFGPGAGGLAFGVIAPVLKPMASQLGSEQVSQTIIVMPMLGLAVGSLIGASVAERLGARRTTWIAGLVLALAGLTPLIAPVAPVLLIDCFLVGLASSNMYISTTLLLADRYSDLQRSRVLGYCNAFGAVTSAASVMITGVIADHFGWQGAFLQFTCAGSVIVIFTLTAVRDPRQQAREAAPAAPFSLLMPMLPIFSMNFLIFAIALALYTHIPLLLALGGTSSITMTSTVIAMQSVFGIVAGCLYGSLQARLGMHVVAIIGLCLMAAGCALTAVSHTPMAYAAACAAVGGGIGLVTPYVVNVLLNKAPPSIRPRALGVLTASGFVGGFASPLIMRPIRELAGLHGLFMVLAAVTAMVGAAAIIARPRNLDARAGNVNI